VGRGGNSRSSKGISFDYLQHLDNTTTSFFFTNFPEDASSEDLWRLFLKYGRVWEVYIPKKVDKRGRRFGFMKFKEVKEVEALTESLTDVWLGTFKLHVNRSRFNRSEKKEVQLTNVPPLGLLAIREEDKSGNPYRSALLGAPGSGNVRGAYMVIKAAVNESLRKELKGSVVGKLAQEKDVKRIQSILMMEGFKSIYVTHLGSNMVVLRSPVEGDVDRLLRSKNECLEYFFSELRPWAPNIVSVHRETWIQVFGIPLHIWGEDFFKQVGSKLGVFLDYDEETASMRRFDVARIWIQTDICAAIDTVIKVDVEGMIFNVRVVEERGRVGPVVAVEEGLLDEGSQVVPSEASGDEEEVFGGGDGNSGDDEASEPEVDGDVSVTVQKGGNHEEARVCDMREEEVRKRNDPLSSGKSTKIPDSNEGIKSAVQIVGGNELLVTKLGDKGSELVGPTQGVDVACEGVNGCKTQDFHCTIF
jgi:hypothetical protein